MNCLQPGAVLAHAAIETVDDVLLRGRRGLVEFTADLNEGRYVDACCISCHGHARAVFLGDFSRYLGVSLALDCCGEEIAGWWL